MRLLPIKKKPSFLEAIEDHESFYLVRLKGNVETHAIETGYDLMTKIIEEAKIYTKPVLCDFSKVMDTDTATVAAIVKRFSEYRKHGGTKFVLFGIQGELAGIFEITHMNKIFTVYATEEEAMAELAQ